MSRGARLGLIAAAVAIAVVAFIALRPGDDDDGERSGAPASEQRQEDGADAPEGEPAPAPDVERIEVRGGEPVGGVQDIAVQSGDEVRLAVTSDVAAHVHVHGYDLFRDVGPGKTARFRFDAEIEGIFEVELEDSHTPIAELRVEP